MLGKVSHEEKEVLEFAIERAADAIEAALKDGFEKAMNQFNTPRPSQSDDSSPDISKDQE